MALNNCIPGLVADGQISREQGDRALGLFEELRRDYRRQFGDQAADAMASADALRALRIEAAERKRQTLLQVQAQKGALDAVGRYRGNSLGSAVLALFDHDGKAPYRNVAILAETIRGRAHALMQGILDRHSRDLLGRMRHPAEMADIVRELFGENSGKAEARELASAWEETSEWLRRRYNAAGGHIGKLERWGLPQSHDPAKVRAAGYDAWRAALLPELDRARMIDRRTGKPMTDESLELVLKDSYEAIVSDGWSRRKEGAAGGKKAANRRADHRFLIFANPDGWLSYHERFGSGGTPFDVMIGHVDGMARDIAHMEILGPNPTATVRWLQDHVRKQAALKGEGQSWFGSAEGQAEAIGKLYEVTSGAASIPVNAKWARGLGAFRATLTAAKLGAAVFSATTDIGFQATTRAFNGLPVTGAITGYLKLLNPLAKADRQTAVRLGLIANEAGRMAAGIDRYLGETMTHGIAARLADGVLRASGLNAWTQAGKWAFGMEFLGHLSDQRALGFDALDPVTRAALERYGIGADGWDAMRASTPYSQDGADFMDPLALEQDLADRVLQMVVTETGYAVPEVSARARSLTSFGRPGTFAGEIGRNMMQFKGFGVSMILTHGRRAMSLSAWNRAKYAAGLVVTTTLLGAMAMQMKELSKGRDPVPMGGENGNWQFWTRAMLQGGGFGIFGDFLGTAANQALAKGSGSQRAGSLAEAFAGPAVGAAADAARFGFAPIDKKGREATRLIKGYTPGSSLWYTRLAFERLVIDTVGEWSDPGYPDYENRMHRYVEKQGQDYWWDPGDLAPERAPDLENAFNGT